MSVTITATTILSQNGYTTTDFAAVDVERMIDDAIDTVNLLAAQSMDALAGSAGTKTVIVTRLQAPVVKMLISLVLRENKKTALSNSSSTTGSSSTNSSINVGPVGLSEGSSVSNAISATAAINNPNNSVFVSLFKESCAKLAALTPPVLPTSNVSPFYFGTDTS